MSNLNEIEKIRNSKFETMTKIQMFKMPTPTLILPLPEGGGGNKRERDILFEF